MRFEIRPLSLGDDENWFSLEGPVENIEVRKKKLIQNLLMPQQQGYNNFYLIAFNNGIPIGKISGQFAQEKAIISKMHSDSRFEAIEILKGFIAYLGEDKKYEALCWDKEQDIEWENLLINFGFHLLQEKEYYEKMISKYVSPYEEKFAFLSLKEIGKHKFINYLGKIYRNNLNRNFIYPKTDFENFINISGKDYSEIWKISLINNKTCGVLLPIAYPDVPQEGTILSFGVFQNYRNKGYGSALHAKGLELLSKLGVLRYVGSTDIYNSPMKKVFIKNNCNPIGIRKIYGLSLPSTANDPHSPDSASLHR